MIFIIVISFLEMILPKGNMGRFVKTTIGLIIILVIINPFIKLVKGDIDIEKEVFKNIESQYNYKQADQGEFAFNQEEQIKTIYRERIEAEIKNNFIEKTKYTLSKSVVKFNESKDSKDYGNIESLELLLVEDKSEEDKVETSSNISGIKDINIDIRIEDDEKSKIKKQPEYIKGVEEIEDIRNNLSKEFEISKDKIFIGLETKE